MGWNNIKRRPADVEYSLYIRAKANGKCQKCGRVCELNGERFFQLEASHYFGRAKESVRFDDRNVHALCSTCHKRMGGYTRKEDGEYDRWIKYLLGEQGYMLLKLEAHLPGSKKDDVMTRLVIKQKMKELKNVSNSSNNRVS